MTRPQPPHWQAPPPGWRPPPRRKLWPLLLVVPALGVMALVLGGIVALFAPDPPGTAQVARSTPASSSAETGAPSAGIPPKPDPATEAAYIAALVAIDPDIVHGEHEKAVDRGRNQCRSIADHPGDRARQVALTQARFSSPSHPSSPDLANPGGFGPEVAARILDVVHQHLCPTY